MTTDTRRIIQVYNADGDALSVVIDAIHKVMSPASYPCSLCNVSYGPLSVRTKWRNYLGRLDADVLSLHRDEFRGRFPATDVELPAILIQEPGAEPRVLLSKYRLDTIRDVDDLIAATDRALASA